MVQGPKLFDAAQPAFYSSSRPILCLACVNFLCIPFLCRSYLAGAPGDKCLHSAWCPVGLEVLFEDFMNLAVDVDCAESLADLLNLGFKVVESNDAGSFVSYTLKRK